MSKHPIPTAALDDRLGFIGTSGSGKTYNAGGAVERLLDRGARVVIVDPLGVWWGLRLLSDGKTASSHDVAIFGGPHGDLPLNEHAGALIGETAATMAESCIVDLSQLGTKSSERRFMTAFLETIYRKANGEPFHLVVDEADLFAPQKPPKGDETLLNLMEQIVRRGRVKGFIPWLISQRPAVVNKNVLSQVDGLIAFKLTASQDRDALDGWIEGQADKAQGKAIKDALPALQVGQGVVWVPGRGVLDTAAFPPKDTFDSSRTPKRGEKMKRTAALEPLDLGALKNRLATVEAETKANDPKALRGEIAKLQKDLREALSKSAEIIQKPFDPKALKQAERDGSARGEAETAPIWLRRGVEAAMKGVKDYAKAFDMPAFIAKEVEAWTHIGAIPKAVPRSAPSETPRSVFCAKPSTPIAVSADGFDRPQMRVLRSLAMWQALGHDAPTREMVAAGAGYKAGSGGFNNLLGGLGTMSAIGKPMPGRVSLLTEFSEVMSREDGRDMLIASLEKPQCKLVSALNGAGAMTREELAQATNYAPGSGGFNNLIGSLSTLGIIMKPYPGSVALSGWAQELLSGYEIGAAA